MAACWLLAVAVISSVWADPAAVKKRIEHGTMDDKISYAIGYDVGSNLKDTIKINKELFFQGIKDSLAGQPNMTGADIMAAIQAFQSKARAKRIEAGQKKLAENRAAGQAYLAENKTKDGVTELASGLQYKVIKPGEGASPTPGNTVTCHYRGTLIDGREFDSSYSRNKPAIFQVDGVIKGWTEALQLMKVGARWLLYVPPELAYGDRGAGSSIEPGATLIFEVELLAIEE